MIVEKNKLQETIKKVIDAVPKPYKALFFKVLFICLLLYAFYLLGVSFMSILKLNN